VKIKTDKTPKLANRGVQCVFVGYLLGHSGDTYRMWNPVTDGIHQTRDVIWLQQMYYKLVEQHPTLPSKKTVTRQPRTRSSQQRMETNLKNLMLMRLKLVLLYKHGLDEPCKPYND
jgi:hypothetical protein